MIRAIQHLPLGAIMLIALVCLVVMGYGFHLFEHDKTNNGKGNHE